jgi:hypothetical protein
MKCGFIVDDYAAIPFGKNSLVIIHNGSQIGQVKTKKQTLELIKTHRSANPKTVPSAD